MSTRQRGNRWQADIYDKEGARYRPQFPTKQEALAWEAQAKLAISQGKPLPPSPATTAKTPNAPLETLQGLLDYVVRTHWGDAKSAQTLIKNGRDVVRFFGRDCNPARINSTDIERMKAQFKTKGARPATVNRKLSALSKLLKVGHSMGLVERMPLINWEREEKTKFRYLDEDEQGQLLDYWLDCYHVDMYEFCVFLLDTGARLSEALEVVYEPSKPYVNFWRTKTGKPRTVPLTRRCFEVLNNRAKGMFSKPAPRLFKSLNQSTIRKDWKQMQRQLNWPDVTPHTLRHTCCTRLVSKGVDIKRVMEWMGHTNINTTQRYMQISPQGLKDVVHVLENDNKIMPIAAQVAPIAA